MQKINRKVFFDHVRARPFNGSIYRAQVEGLEFILAGWEKGWADKDLRWLAYMLATAHHETDRKMQPIEEYGRGANYAYGKRVKMSGQPYTDTDSVFYGRGYVQLTWYENYDKAGKKLGLDLLRRPQLALDPLTSAQIMFFGMTEGWFTGRKLADYIQGDKCDYMNARRIINGTDRADVIAQIARNYEVALDASAEPDFSDVIAGVV